MRGCGTVRCRSMAGTYTITARAPGSSPWSTQVTIAAASDTRTVGIPDLRNLPHDLDKPAPAAAPPAAAPPRPSPVVPAADHTPDHPPAASHPSRTGPIVLGVGGLALLGGGLGFELWARSKYDAAKSEMMSQSRRDSLQDAANTRRYVAEGLAVSGVVAGGVAVWLYLRRGGRERDAMTDTSMHVVPTTTGLAVSGRF